MNEHKHYPVSGCGLVRIWKLLFSDFKFRKIIDWETRTARCSICGALIRVPKRLQYVLLFTPIICTPTACLCLLPIVSSHMSDFLKTAIGLVLYVLIGLFIQTLISSSVMAFCKWEVVEIGDQSLDDVKCRLQKEVRLMKMEKPKWIKVADIAITLISLAASWAMIAAMIS